MSADDTESDALRRELARLVRNKKARTHHFSASVPTDWNPSAVHNPETGIPFSEESAWEFIAELLEAGHPIVQVELRKPAGAIAFEMTICLESTRPDLYMKIQPFGGGKVHGRSFHYSTHR